MMATDAVRLDQTDLRLLGLLKENARQTNQVLAAKLAIAPSTGLARLKHLKSSGVIERFTVELDPESLGLPLQAFVSVRLRAGARHLMNDFAAEMRNAPEVSQFFVLGAADDFLVHITARDTEHVRQFVLDRLSSNPAVAGTQTSLVFEHGRGSNDLV